MGNRNNHRRGGRRRDPEQVQKKEPEVFPDCPLCGKPLKDMHSAISSRETGEPSHFECVVKKLTEEEEMKPDERICYLGHGEFGIILPRASSGPVKFTIRKKIQYESMEKKAEWRMKVCGGISSLIH